MSPERVDPGREDWTTKTTPKVVGGINEASTKAAAEVYRAAIDTVHEVSTPEAAELTKLLENIYRAVNIALVNELAQLTDRMGIDVWEVVDAAATKPFGFASFKPGPGLGGHCIPIDPFYLTWKAREFDFSTRFIELAGEVNNNMPYFCRSLISQALNHGATQVGQRREDPDPRRRLQARHRRHARDAGREADPPAEERRRGRLLPRPVRARVRRHDVGRRSSREDYDCVAIVTNHSGIDYGDVVAARQRDRRLPQRHQGPRDRRQGLEALGVASTRVGVVGLNYWGPNLVRNFDELAELAWLCDLDDAAARALGGALSGRAQATADYDDLLADDTLDAVVVATPVPTHYALAKQALEAGKHVFVEKPPAMRAAEMDELVALAADARPRADARAPAALPPRRAEAEGADRRRASSATCSASTATGSNLGIVRTNENALWSLGVHDLSVILYLLDEDPEVATAQGSATS